jgi:hypothetical protein
MDQKEVKPDEVTVSIITSVTTKKADLKLLRDTYNSLMDQELENWEWLLVIGQDQLRALQSMPFREATRVHSTAISEQVTAGAARNLALYLANGKYVTSVNQGDQLPPQSLSVRVNALEDNDQIRWVCGHLANYLHGDAETYYHPMGTGSYERGDVAKRWHNAQNTFVLPPSGLMASRRVFESVGGWGGTVRSSNLMMAAAIANNYPGEVIDDVVYHFCNNGSAFTTANRPYVEYDFESRGLAWRRIH